MHIISAAGGWHLYSCTLMSLSGRYFSPSGDFIQLSFTPCLAQEIFFLWQKPCKRCSMLPNNFFMFSPPLLRSHMTNLWVFNIFYEQIINLNMLRSTPTSSAPSRSPISKVFYCFGGSLSVSFFLATELLKIFTFFSFFLARFKVLFAFVKVMIGIYEASSVCSLISFRRQTTRCAKPYLNQSN